MSGNRLFISLSLSLFESHTHTRVHRPCLTAHFSHQTFPPTSTQAVLAVSPDIISHTIQHVLTTHSLLPHQHAAQQYANTTSFSRPLHMSTQLSLRGTEDDLSGVWANSLEWFLLTAYLQRVQLRQELEGGFPYKLDGVLIEMTARKSDLDIRILVCFWKWVVMCMILTWNLCVYLICLRKSIKLTWFGAEGFPRRPSQGWLWYCCYGSPCRYR